MKKKKLKPSGPGSARGPHLPFYLFDVTRKESDFYNMNIN